MCPTYSIRSRIDERLSRFILQNSSIIYLFHPLNLQGDKKWTFLVET
jgi:hypothetical protein